MFRKRVTRIRGVAGSLEESTVLVVDAARGPGPGIVRVIAEAGAAVVAASADSASLDVQLSRLDTSPVPVTSVIADIKAAETAIGILSSLRKPVDALVVNPSPEDPDTIQPLLELAGETTTQMQDRGHAGAIVFITGIDRIGPAGSAAAFLEAEVRDLAARVAPNGIRVNAVAPGPIGMNRRGNPVSHRATPLGHVTVHPVEIGKAVWFLLNDRLSSAMTGTTLKIDRGASLLRPDW